MEDGVSCSPPLPGSCFSGQNTGMLYRNCVRIFRGSVPTNHYLLL